MIFLANENIPQNSIELLRTDGFSVISIKEENRGVTDKTILQLATTYKAIILTYDKDYGEIVFRENWTPIPSIIFFRFKGYNAEFVYNKLKELIGKQVEFTNFFTVIDENGIRQRSLK